jgi:hypothetical protein
MRHGAGQVQTGRRIVLIVHDLVGEEGAAGGGLRWESEMGRRRKEAFTRLDWSLTGEGSAWAVLASRTWPQRLVHPSLPHFSPNQRTQHRQLDKVTIKASIIRQFHIQIPILP